jgi:peptidoglycan/xylan/chitin deacetylase (PgdA/CDA1 family)
VEQGHGQVTPIGAIQAVTQRAGFHLCTARQVGLKEVQNPRTGGRYPAHRTSMPSTSSKIASPARPPWKERVEDIAARSPLQAAFARSAANRLAVLAYHGIDNPKQFAAHLDELRRVARPVSLDDVIDAVRNGDALPPRSVLVTFDDGQVSVRDHGMPLLAERGIPAAAFVVPGLLDTDRPYWWDEVAALAGDTLVETLKAVPDRQRLDTIDELRAQHPDVAIRGEQLRAADLPAMEKAGIAIGNHSLDHPCLDQCTTEEISRQVTEAHGRLSSVLGHAPLGFAYPNGNFDPRVVDAVAGCGYAVAFTFDHRLSDRTPSDPLLISRVRVNSTTSMARFRTILSGMHPAFLRAAMSVRRQLR